MFLASVTSFLCHLFASSLLRYCIVIDISFKVEIILIALISFVGLSELQLSHSCRTLAIPGPVIVHLCDYSVYNKYQKTNKRSDCGQVLLKYSHDQIELKQ